LGKATERTTIKILRPTKFTFTNNFQELKNNISNKNTS